MNQKTAKALRREIKYHPHQPERKYIKFHIGYRQNIKFVIGQDGKVTPKVEPIEMYQVMYDDQHRKLYKALKKKYTDPNSNEMTHFRYEESETTEEKDHE